MEVEVEAEVTTEAGVEAEVAKLSIRQPLNATSVISLGIFSMSVQLERRKSTILN
jgi:hypothetical protein